MKYRRTNFRLWTSRRYPNHWIDVVLGTRQMWAMFFKDRSGRGQMIKDFQIGPVWGMVVMNRKQIQ